MQEHGAIRNRRKSLIIFRCFSKIFERRRRALPDICKKWVHDEEESNRYQFTISERSIQNLEAAIADSDNLTQFMQATAYVRFKPDTEERSTYLYRAYTKWCEDNLESPVPQKKFSQFLLKNAGKYGLAFSKHIEGKFAFMKRSETMKSPVGLLSDRTVLRQQDGGASPRQVRLTMHRMQTMQGKTRLSCRCAKSVQKCAEPQKMENPTRNLTILRWILVCSRELESLAL